MKPTFKKIILFVVIIIAVTVVAVLVLGKNDSTTTRVLQTTNLSTTTTPTASTNDSGKFLQSLSQVKSINLDTTFFKNKSYQKLVDFSITPVIEDPRIIGRPNPFAPIGADYISNTPNNSNDTVDQNTKKTN